MELNKKVLEQLAKNTSADLTKLLVDQGFLSKKVFVDKTFEQPLSVVKSQIKVKREYLDYILELLKEKK